MKYFYFLGWVLFITTLNAQNSKYWIYFKDKPENQKPDLSHRSLERRFQQGILLDEKDYPVSTFYIQQLENFGFTIERKSKWLNAVTLYADYQDIQKLKNLNFIIQIEPVKKWKVYKPAINHHDKTAINYGASEIQNKMLNIEYLHDKGFKGAGKLVGVFDSGFINANQHPAFSHIYNSNRVLATYNFVNNNTNVYTLDGHGTNVWSCIAANVPDTLVGTGFEASFLLAVTENVFSETTAEEDNWLAAMEWADSLGVDIINTSLGYNIMDGGLFYTYADMDGNSTIITRAADIAASKGILCVISAGNEGNNDWKKITAPCDADSVLCVGSVNSNKSRSSFSSMGPTFDGRIKPDVMAMGGTAAVASTNLNYSYSSGTSFSAPIITGFVASLWQANPNKTNMEIIDAIKKSSDRASNPDTLYGWGIPNAARADSLLKGFTIKKDSPFQNLIIYPNPAKDKIYFENLPPQTFITLYDFSGKQILHTIQNNRELNLMGLAKGWYWLKFSALNSIYSYKIFIE